MKRQYLHEACEQIDAAIFSGDVLYDDEDRKELEEYIARWYRAIEQHKAEIASEQEPDQVCSACFVRGCNGECMEF